jgi:hypothetical protein
VVLITLVSYAPPVRIPYGTTLNHHRHRYPYLTCHPRGHPYGWHVRTYTPPCGPYAPTVRVDHRSVRTVRGCTPGQPDVRAYGPRTISPHGRTGPYGTRTSKDYRGHGQPHGPEPGHAPCHQPQPRTYGRTGARQRDERPYDVQETPGVTWVRGSNSARVRNAVPYTVPPYPAAGQGTCGAYVRAAVRACPYGRYGVRHPGRTPVPRAMYGRTDVRRTAYEADAPIVVHPARPYAAYGSAVSSIGPYAVRIPDGRDVDDRVRASRTPSVRGPYAVRTGESYAAWPYTVRVAGRINSPTCGWLFLITPLYWRGTN